MCQRVILYRFINWYDKFRLYQQVKYGIDNISNLNTKIKESGIQNSQYTPYEKSLLLWWHMRGLPHLCSFCRVENSSLTLSNPSLVHTVNGMNKEFKEGVKQFKYYILNHTKIPWKDYQTERTLLHAVYDVIICWYISGQWRQEL